MANTITAFYDFTPGTKARSSEVDTNFSNFRGDLIPIEPLTATGSHLTYDLGSTEYRFDVIYARILDLIGMTTTANLRIERDNAVTAGAFKLQVGSATVGEVRSTGVWLQRNVARTSTFSFSMAGSAVTLTSSVLSFTAYATTIEFGLISAAPNTISALQISNNGNTTSGFIFGNLNYYMDGTVIGKQQLYLQGETSTTLTLVTPPPGLLHKFDVTLGGHTFYVTMESNTTTSRFYAFEVQLMVRD